MTATHEGNPTMKTPLTSFAIGCIAGLLSLTLVASPALADQPLKSALGLDMAQAAQVDAIEAKYRQPFAAKRQERNAELRKARRARLANDSAALAQHEAASEKLHAELQRIFHAKNADIRAVLSAPQRVKFEQQLALNKEMKGSARDAKDM
jgi:hypothetical protein